MSAAQPGFLEQRLRGLLHRLLPRLARRIPLIRLGSAYGGWWIPVDALKPGDICYCGGVGEDASFDRLLAEQQQCVVYAFDPTPRATEYVRREMSDVPRFHFAPIGLWSSATTLRFYAPADPSHVSHSAVNLQNTSTYFEATCKPVEMLMKEHGHARIALLKLDIEGAEHEVLRSLLASGLKPGILCFEIDQPCPVGKCIRTLLTVWRGGYRLVKVEGWNFTFVLRSLK